MSTIRTHPIDTFAASSSVPGHGGKVNLLGLGSAKEKKK
jgi:hypothetical protein